MQGIFFNHQASSSAGHQEKSTEGKTPCWYHTPGPAGLGPSKRVMCLFSKSQQPGFNTWGRAANECGKSVEPKPENKSYRPSKPSCLLASSLLSVPLHLLRDDLLGNKHSSQFWGQDFFPQLYFGQKSTQSAFLQSLWVSEEDDSWSQSPAWVVQTPADVCSWFIILEASSDKLNKI